MVSAVLVIRSVNEGSVYVAVRWFLQPVSHVSLTANGSVFHLRPSVISATADPCESVHLKPLAHQMGNESRER